MAEAATSETLTFLVKIVQESLDECEDFWQTMDEQPKLLSLVDFSAGEEEEKANDRIRKLITLHTRTSLLSDIYAPPIYSHGRATQTILQSLTGRRSALGDLGALQRACVWEHITLKSALSARNTDLSSPDDIFSGLLSGSGAAATVQDGQAPTPAGERTADTPSGASTNGATPGKTAISSAPATSTPAKKEEQAWDRNAKGLKYLVTQIPSALGPFFQSIVRLIQTLRSSGTGQKAKIKEAAAVLADIIVKHLEQKPLGDKLSLFSYYTSMLNATMALLVDERPSQRTLHTMLLVAFNRVGGLEALFGLAREFLTTIDTVTQVNADERSEIAKQELTHAFNGLKVALSLIQPLVSSRALFDSTQTPLAITTDKKDTDAAYFEPHKFLVRMRHPALPLVRSVWEAPWLPSAPIGVSKLGAHIVMELLNVENEEVKDVQTSASILGAGALGVPRIPVAAPDENRIRQLMDMSFPRSATERALLRTRNNVNAATELLLAQPYPLPPDPEPVAEAQPAPVEGEAAAPAEGQVDMQAEGQAGSQAEGQTEGHAEVPADGDAAPVASVEASSATPASEPVPAAAPEEPPAPPGKSGEGWVKELNAAREPLKEGIGRRVLSLVEEHSSLVFDVQKVFVGPTSEYRTEAVKAVIDDIQAFSPSAYDVQEQPLSVRCHLLALVLGEPSSPASQMPEKEAENLMNVLWSLLVSNPGEDGHPVIPKWLSAQLLVIESLLVSADPPRSISLPKENEPIVRQSIAQGPRYAEARNSLFDFCMRLLAVPTLPKDELISVLRLIVLLTRDQTIAESFVKRNGVGLPFQYLRVSSGTQSGTDIQSYIAIIVRHVIENQATLQHVMRQEVKRFFSHPHTCMVEVSASVSGCNSTALRAPGAFVKVMEELWQLAQPYSSVKTISLKPSSTPPAQAPATSENKSNEMQVDEPTLPVASPPNAQAESSENVIHYLVGEKPASAHPRV